MKGGKKINFMKKVKKKTKRKRYYSFKMRVFSCFILFILFLSIGVYFLLSATKITHSEKLSYDEKGNIDYTVCLKQNDFYEDKCVSNNMTYVASLIDNINLTYNYAFNINKDILEKNNFEYEVTAKLVIQNSEDMSNFYEYFTVYNDINSKYNIPNTSVSSIKVPLSQKSIQIKLDSKETNKKDNKVVYTNEFCITNWIYIIISIILLVLSLIPLIKGIKLINKLGSNKTDYDKFISKILKEYDRLVAETKSLPLFDKYNIMEINGFNELLDVRDNLKLPIMYYNVTMHQKAYFYIVYGKNLYLYTVKSSDFSEK